MNNNYFGEQVGLPGNNFLDDQMKSSGISMNIEPGTAALIGLGISAVAGGFSVAGGAAQDKANKEQVKLQYKKDKKQHKYENALALDNYNYETKTVEFARKNNEREIKYRQASDKQQYEQQLAIRQAKFDADKSAFNEAEKEATLQEKVNKKSFDLAEKQSDQWLEDQKTDKMFKDEKATLELAQTIDKAADLYGQEDTKFKQEKRGLRDQQQKAKLGLKQETRKLNVENRYQEDMSEFATEAAQADIDDLDTDKNYLKAKRETDLQGLTAEKAQSWHDTENAIDRKNLDRDEQQAMLDADADLASYNNSFDKDNARLDTLLATKVKDHKIDSLDNTAAQLKLDKAFNLETSRNALNQEGIESRNSRFNKRENLKLEELSNDLTKDKLDSELTQEELASDISQTTSQTNIDDLENKFKALSTAELNSQEDTLIKKLQASGDLGASGRAGASATAAIQASNAQMNRDIARSDARIMAGRESTDNLQGLEEARIVNEKSKIADKRDIKSKEKKYQDDQYGIKSDQTTRDIEDEKKLYTKKKEQSKRERQKIRDDSREKREQIGDDKSLVRAEHRNTTRKLANQRNQSEGQTRRLLNRIGDKKTYVDAKANSDIDKFRDDFNLKENAIKVQKQEVKDQAKRDLAKNKGKMDAVQRNLDKTLIEAGYNIVRNDNAITAKTDNYNQTVSSLAKQEKTALENMGMNKENIEREVTVAAQNEELNSKIRDESLKSAKKQNKFDVKKLKLDKFAADVKADGIRKPEPSIGPEVPKPIAYPKTKFQNPNKPIPTPEPIKGAANTSNTLAAVGSGLKSIAGADWGKILG